MVREGGLMRRRREEWRWGQGMRSSAGMECKEVLADQKRLNGCQVCTANI